MEWSKLTSRSSAVLDEATTPRPLVPLNPKISTIECYRL